MDGPRKMFPKINMPWEQQHSCLIRVIYLESLFVNTAAFTFGAYVDPDGISKRGLYII